jgi:Ca-activated chloride channel family protein
MKNLKMFSSGIAMLVLFTSFVGIKTLTQKPEAQRTITGTVTESGNPMSAVNVSVQGTTKITQTDSNGKYTIKAGKGDILQFSFLGYKDKKVRVANSNVININMETGSQTLDEVVVTSPTIKHEKKALGYAVTKVPGFTISEKVTNNIVIRGYASTNNADKARLVHYAMASEKDDKNAAANLQKGRLITADPNDEDYGAFIENPFEAPKNAPLSTFSIDVDNASYTNIRRFINNGQAVPKDAVRVEEMVNFFKYQYPQPKDEHPFSINTEYSESPWNNKHKLLRIGLQGKNIPMDNLPASNLVFLIDVSGSMSDANKLPLLVQSMKILVQQLRNEDKVSIVVYAGAAGMVLPPTPGSEKQTITDALERLSAGGSTAGGAGIELAYKTAQQNFIKDGNNRVILATDGDFNVGAASNESMEKLIEDKRKSGVFLTVLGYGMGNYKDSKMEILADKGNGNYAYIDNIQEANRFLGKEFKGSMFAIAKDVKIQIEFNPNQVQAYRLIGYENRKLRPEDFTNDKIDAGELGSGHTVTALYEIIPAGVKSDFAETTPKLKYTKTQPTGSVYKDELATVKFRYKNASPVRSSTSGPDADSSIEMTNVIANRAETLEHATNDFKFSASVAWFGLKLRDSKLITNKSSNDIKALAKQGLANDVDGYRAEFVRLIDGEVKKIAGLD